MQAPMQEATQNEIDLPRLGRALVARKWWVLGPTLAAFFGAFLFVSIAKPRYTSDARLLLENQDDFFTRVDKGERADANGPDAEGVQSQIQLLTSRDLARRVIRTLGLQGNPEFDPLARGVGALARVMALLGIARDPTLMSPEDRILEKFSEKLAVLSPTKTRVLSIEFSSHDPDLSARGANAVADAYIEIQQEAKREIARNAAKSLAALVEDLQVRVADAEAKVEAYRAQTGLLVGSNNATIPTQQLGELNNQLSTARAAQADAQARANLLRDMLRQKRIGEIPDVANNETIRRIFEQRVALQARIALESRTLLPMHPRVKELNAQLADLDRQWRAVAERTAHTLENEVHIAAARVDNLTRVLDDQKRVAGAAGAEEVKLRDLERSARLLKEQLESETAKYQEALARERLKATPADARVIQRALAPQIPSFPKKIPVLVFATLAGSILSLGAVVAGEMLTGRVSVSPPSEPFPGPPSPEAAVGAVQEPFPDGKDVQDQPDFGEEPSPRVASRFADAARAAGQCVTVLIAPCSEAGPPAQTAVALARTLAPQGRALLVSADPGATAFDALVGPSQSRPAGMAELLGGVAGFDAVIHRDASSRLHVLPGGGAAGADAGDPALIVAALAQAYDFLIFAASAEEARRLASHMDLAFVLGKDDASAALLEEIRRLGVEAHFLDEAARGDIAA
ncbi:MAG: lipopolysaccharide biosynthesis protein [Hyphomicrobiales bacterium]|nr:MAG: lipopolysaccharide biosynthesis protein [Hyphomicrobiales bacterium]